MFFKNTTLSLTTLLATPGTAAAVINDPAPLVVPFALVCPLAWLGAVLDATEGQSAATKGLKCEIVLAFAGEGNLTATAGASDWRAGHP